MIRKIIGFIPAAFIFFLILTAPAMEINYFTPYALCVLINTPWYMWLWLAASVLSGVLLCIRKTLVPGLIAGVLPWIVFSVTVFANQQDHGLHIFPAGFTLAYIVYAVCYFVYHHEADKKS